MADSEYQKRQDGDSTVFEVTPATAPKYVYAIVLGVIAVLGGLGSQVWFFAVVGVALLYFGWAVDPRPRGHKSKAIFRVSSRVGFTR